MNRRTALLARALPVCAFASLFATNARASDASPPPTPAPVEATPPVAEPQHHPAFGDAGEWVISAGTNLGFLHASNDGNALNAFEIEPSLDYFVVPHLSVGAELTLYYGTEAGTKNINYGAAPRVGYDVPLSEGLSVRPTASFDILHMRDTYGAPSNGVYSETQADVELYVPLLIHPASHFFLGFGPDIGTYVKGPSDTFVGAKLTLGGWFGG